MRVAQRSHCSSHPLLLYRERLPLTPHRVRIESPRRPAAARLLVAPGVYKGERPALAPKAAAVARALPACHRRAGGKRLREVHVRVLRDEPGARHVEVHRVARARHGREADAHDVERLPLDEVRSDDEQDQVIDDQPDLINVLLARLRGRAASCCWAAVAAAAVALRLGLLAAGSAAIQRPRSCRSAVRSGVCCSIATDRSSG